MKFVYIGTYPPRECGIGSFTRDLYYSMAGDSTNNKGFIVAINNSDEKYSYPKEVKLTIQQENRNEYIAAAKHINNSGADVCILQHEFGIFGGQSGIYILSLLHSLKIHLVVTLHTISNTPSYTEKAILKEICKMANMVVVMNLKAIDFLTDIYDVPREKIAFIEHGVPDFHFDQKKVKKEFKLEEKKILLTFGFLSRNKGIEVAIKALPKLVKKHPNIIYLVLGKIHPSVMRSSGDEYLVYLRQLIKDLTLEDHVIIPNEYVPQEDLFKYLYASDIYITPYNNEAQITSGTLSYAVGAGSAVISTPYWHATELLANGVGRLFDFHNSNQLTDILIELLDEPETLHALRKKAYEYGRNLTWPKTGIKYNNLMFDTLQDEIEIKEQSFDILNMPPLSLRHIHRLTDDTGIIQHAKFNIPNLKDGYCLDDNARALLMALLAYKGKNNYKALELCPIYLSYIHYMQNEDGTFRNFLGFDRSFLDEVGSEDSFGRTIWALGYLLSNPPNYSYYQSGESIFKKAVPVFDKLKSIRSIANTIIGISYYLKRNPADDSMTELLSRLSKKLVESYETNSSDSWRWFEPFLTYDNAMLPLALLHAAEIHNDDKIRKTAFSSMEFLISKTFANGYLSIIGNDSWYEKDGKRAVFAQQPLDAMAMILLFKQAFKLTKNIEYLEKLFTSYMWFHGENDLRIGLYDSETNGCCDGLESYGVNRNQGAESTLAYLISHLTVLQAHKDFNKASFIKKRSPEKISQNLIN
ncbi:glycosyltransferase family 4 protein [Labilibaculum sp. K2S]|uniref:glycosyltransferase family 4 protein n=1 Tax=Labilibaculum sp. K2S TaxID=3056386 RepID=UPI0025A3BE38|nr:glycosyltransferase family 4 protein [Labilibaculum sp. K2S]MDM8161068.1 glycosyltransferase family 4 protein [Labilibaculum sp. K2S]